MKSKSSSGVDNINSRVIKYVASFIALPLPHIFNLTFATGKIPNEFKTALITPVYKSSDTNVFSNFRPISVLSLLFKD